MVEAGRVEKPAQPPLIGTANPTAQAGLPHCAGDRSDGDCMPLLAGVLMDYTRTRRCFHPHSQESRVNPFQALIARFLAWAVSWPITIGILVWWWWLDSDRAA
jgi:hypothetical protein